MNPTKLYTQSIVFFGFVIPVLITAIIIGIGFAAKSKMSKSFALKKVNYKTYTMNMQKAKADEAAIGAKRADMVRWEKLVSNSTATTVSSNLRQIEKTIDPKELQPTGQQFPTTKSGFATVNSQKSSQVELSFRATFRSMQKVLLDLETRMPQLQLQEFRIKPNNNSQSLAFDVSYTSWEK